MLRTHSLLYKPNAITAQQMAKNIKKQLPLALPDIERLNPMRKATDKINIKDELHPFEPLKNLRHEIPIKTKKLAAAGNGKDPDDWKNKLKNFDNLNVLEKYQKNNLELKAKKISK